jgi:hypothetical protein
MARAVGVVLLLSLPPKPKEREMEKTIIFFDQFDDFCRKHPFVTVGGALLFCVVSDIILRGII